MVFEDNLTLDLKSNLGNKLPQIIAALCATLGSFGMGNVLGWASPAGIKIMDGEYGFPVSEIQNSWIGASATLGAAFACYPIGFIMEKIGRKATMLLLVLPWLLGWVLIITAVNVDMFYAGRFFTGVAGGSFVVTTVTYNSEIAQDEIRGVVGTFFQLMLNIGILFAFIVGGYTSALTLSIVLGTIPIIFGILFIFMPETPHYLMLQKKEEDVRKSLKWLRGSAYDIEDEFNRIKLKIEMEKNNSSTFTEIFSKKASIKALVICLVLMISLQYSGINPVLFNVHEIFSDANTGISAENSSIIVAGIQVITTLFATVLIERAGRIILLLISSILIILSNAGLGAYFYVKDNGADSEELQNISWLPLTSVCIFVTAFSVGVGTVPFALYGDLCTPNTIAFISSSAGTFNWLLAFTITATFKYMQDDMGRGEAFWFFAGITLILGIFIYIFIPETKGKTREEIQTLLGEDPKFCRSK